MKRFQTIYRLFILGVVCVTPVQALTPTLTRTFTPTNTPTFTPTPTSSLTFTPTFSLPGSECSGTLDIASNALDKTHRVYFANVLDSPSVTEPPIANGQPWTRFGYDDKSAGWTDLVCTGINNGMAYVPLSSTPFQVFCSGLGMDGGDATHANWIRPLFSGSARVNGCGFNDGDQWWVRREFTMVSDIYAAHAVLRFAPDGYAQAYIDGQFVDAVGLPQGWDKITEVDVTSLFKPGVTDHVIAWKIINGDDCSLTGLNYALSIDYACGTPSPTPTETSTPVGYCGGSRVLLSNRAQNSLYYDPANSVPALDGAGRDWKDPAYASDPSWIPSTEILMPPGEWRLPCTFSGLNRRWIGTRVNGLPPTLATTYFRNHFTLPAWTQVQGPVSMTLNGDNVVEVWLNGHYLGLFEGPYMGDSHLYNRCVDIQVDPAFFKEGDNVLAFSLVNQMTYHGLSYEMPFTYLCVPTHTPTSTPTETSTYTPTPTVTNTPTETATPTWTVTPTATPTSDLTAIPTDTPPPIRTSTPSPTSTVTDTWTPTFTYTSTRTATRVPTATRTPTATPTHHHCEPVPYPNPCAKPPMCFRVSDPADEIKVTVHSSCNRRMVELRRACGGESDPEIKWDLRDDSGNPVANGAYFATVETYRGGVRVERKVCKTIVLR